MAEKSISNSRYKYIHESGKWSSQTIDLHHVIARKSLTQIGVACLFAHVVLLNACYSFVGKGEAVYVLLFYTVMGVLFIKLLLQRLVEKESVVIIPAFGVQLETHYKSGKAVRRFVPVDKILKPLLNECVTPVTCYWSLALILRDEDEMILVFKELRPPLKILTPIWRALCVVIDSEGSVVPCPDTD